MIKPSSETPILLGALIFSSLLRIITPLNFILISIFITYPNFTYALETAILKRSEIIIIYKKSMQKVAEEIVGFYGALKTELENDIGWEVNFRPNIILIEDSSTFQRIANNNLIVAFAVPEKNQIVVDYSKMNRDPFRIEITLKHELCHLLLHQYIRQGRLPKWIDEGVSQWVSGGISEILRSDKRSLLYPSILSGQNIPIRTLSKRFPEDKKGLLLAYEESKDLISYIISDYGKAALHEILDYLREGDEIENAISKALSISLVELEYRWIQHLKKRMNWLRYLINHLYEILFCLGAFLLIYGFIKVIMKKRAYKDFDEE